MKKKIEETLKDNQEIQQVRQSLETSSRTYIDMVKKALELALEENQELRDKLDRAADQVKFPPLALHNQF